MTTLVDAAIADDEEPILDPEVLLVDPDASSRAALRDIIGPLARVAEAASGEEALQLAAQREVAAILIAVALPGLDGFQTVTQLRKNKLSRNVPVLFLSAAAPDWLAVRRGYALGALGYMTKPVDAHALRAKLDVLLVLFRRGVELRKRDEVIAKQHHEIRQTQAELEQIAASNRAKDLYMGVLGHDLRNPLAAILMSARMMLMRGKLGSEDHETVSRIGRNAERMAALIRDILDYTRGNAMGGLPIVPRPADMGEICASMLEEIGLLHATRNIRFTKHGSLRGTWDRERVEQVISNLLTNALHHSASDILLVVDGSSEQEVTVSVHNEGAIPAEQIPMLFEPFRRGPNSRMGLGLGLYIVREILHAHGGSVDVDSRPSTGTIVTTRWPRRTHEVSP